MANIQTKRHKEKRDKDNKEGKRTQVKRKREGIVE
jgi:hypothetical protein